MSPPQRPQRIAGGPSAASTGRPASHFGHFARTCIGLSYTGTRVASRRYFASNSPTTTVKKSTYKMPVADCVDRIFAVSQVRYDSTAGPASPNSTRCQKKIPLIDVMYWRKLGPKAGWGENDAAI